MYTAANQAPKFGQLPDSDLSRAGELEAKKERLEEKKCQIEAEKAPRKRKKGSTAAKPVLIYDDRLGLKIAKTHNKPGKLKRRKKDVSGPSSQAEAAAATKPAEPSSPKEPLRPYRMAELPVLSPIKVVRPSSQGIVFGGPSTSKAASSLPQQLLAPISDAEIAQMVKIKEEAFDEEGHVNPGWKE